MDYIKVDFKNKEIQTNMEDFEEWNKSFGTESSDNGFHNYTAKFEKIAIISSMFLVLGQGLKSDFTYHYDGDVKYSDINRIIKNDDKLRNDLINGIINDFKFVLKEDEEKYYLRLKDTIFYDSFSYLNENHGVAYLHEKNQRFTRQEAEKLLFKDNEMNMHKFEFISKGEE